MIQKIVRYVRGLLTRVFGSTSLRWKGSVAGFKLSEEDVVDLWKEAETSIEDLESTEADVRREAESFWWSYPAYRGATFEVKMVAREGPGKVHARQIRKKFVVEAISVRSNEEGGIPTSIDMGHALVFEREILDFEKSLNDEGCGFHRVVFLHSKFVCAEYFCACMRVYQARAREEVFEGLYKGDGVAEAQWSEVFGGESR